jgi:hypothetical protein
MAVRLLPHIPNEFSVPELRIPPGPPPACPECGTRESTIATVNQRLRLVIYRCPCRVQFTMQLNKQGSPVPLFETLRRGVK